MSSRPEGIVFIDLHATTNTQDRPLRSGATASPERSEIVQLSGNSNANAEHKLLGDRTSWESEAYEFNLFFSAYPLILTSSLPLRIRNGYDRYCVPEGEIENDLGAASGLTKGLDGTRPTLVREGYEVSNLNSQGRRRGRYLNERDLLTSFKSWIEQ